MTNKILNPKSQTEMIFDQGGDRVFFDTEFLLNLGKGSFIIRNGTHLRWFGVYEEAQASSIEFVVESGSKCDVRILLLSKENTQHLACLGKIVEPNAAIDIHILSLVAEGGNIALDGTVSIARGCVKSSGHILEENIFIGTKGSIQGIPSLLIDCDDVEASHAARIERISDEKLYYLRAHGIPRDDASVMMITGKIQSMFEGLDNVSVNVLLGRVSELFRN